MTASITRLVTHSGAFHADDVCAYALLSGLYPHADLIRTRDAAVLEDHPDTSIVFDVGRVYNPGRARYDHHQPNGPVREDGLPYAAFGLVWRHLGRDWLTDVVEVRPEDLERVHTAMANAFVRQIDQVDVGATPAGFAMATSLSGIISAMNPARIDRHAQPVSITSDDEDAAFLAAAAIAQGAMVRAAEGVAQAVAAAAVVLDKAQHRPHPAVLVLEHSLPWSETVTTHPDLQEILFVVEPSPPTAWSISCARISLDGFASRHLLPESWRGHTGAELDGLTGVAGGIFCHAGGFCGGATSREAAIAMAIRAVPAPA